MRDDLKKFIERTDQNLQGVVDKSRGKSPHGSNPAGQSKLIPIAIVAILAIALIGGGTWYALSTKTPPPTAPAAIDPLADSVALVVCGWRATREDGTVLEIPRATGSAFAITADGYLLTNRHVVEDTVHIPPSKIAKFKTENKLDVEGKVWVFINSQKFLAEVPYVSEQFDMAVLKVNRKFDRPFVLASSDTPNRGIGANAAGYPAAANEALSDNEAIAKQIRHEGTVKNIAAYFSPRDFQFSLTAGVVSRSFEEDNVSKNKWVQHSASISPGNSGGPLLSSDNVVIGINTSVVGSKVDSTSGTAGASPGVSYAQSLNQMKGEIEGAGAKPTWK